MSFTPVTILTLFIFISIHISSGTHYKKLPYWISDFKMNWAAVGDWGVTDGTQHTSAVWPWTNPDNVTELRAYDAQVNVAIYLNQWAKTNAPLDFVLTHGDHFYWSGVAAGSTRRWRKQFEQMYDDPALFVPWYGVMGNHDYGGASGLCGTNCWNCGQFCTSEEELIQALHDRFQGANNYVSKNNDRWQMPAHYYKVRHSYTDSDPSKNFDVDIFNLDTNAAGQRISDTCCQCHSGDNIPYKDMEGENCENPSRNQMKCHRGNTTMFDACKNFFEEFWDQSMRNLTIDLAASDATWKVVHQHYLMKFFTPSQEHELRTILRNGGAHIFWGGHEHAMGHDFDFADRIHYLENGCGGGGHIQSGTGNVFSKKAYGFMAGRISKNYFQIQYIDDSGDVKHCYNIPNDRADADVDPTLVRSKNHPYLCGNMIEGTSSPIPAPSLSPSLAPSPAPTTSTPTASPTVSPTGGPTVSPTGGPTVSPTVSPTGRPTVSPTSRPTSSPTTTPTPGPIFGPTTTPTPGPTSSPTPGPTSSPTTTPTPGPTSSPTLLTSAPTPLPTPLPAYKNPHFTRPTDDTSNYVSASHVASSHVTFSVSYSLIYCLCVAVGHLF